MNDMHFINITLCIEVYAYAILQGVIAISRSQLFFITIFFSQFALDGGAVFVGVGKCKTAVQDTTLHPGIAVPVLDSHA
jgi:hypothetical protein